MKLRRAVFLVVFTALLPLFTIAWPAKVTAQPKESLPVKFGFQANADWLFYTARRSGLFAQAGLKAEFLQFASGREMLAALRSGDIDVATMSEVPFVVGVSQGLDLKLILTCIDISRNHGVVVRRDSGINSIKDLQGKRVSYTRGSGAHASLAAALKQAELTTKDSQLLDLPPSTAFLAFEKNEVQGVFTWQPWIERLVDSGGKVLAFDFDLGVTTMNPWIARTEWVKQNPEAAKRLIGAAELGRQQLEADPVTGIREVAGVLKVSEAAAKRIYERDVLISAKTQGDPSSRFSLVSPNGTAKLVTAKAALLKGAGVINKDLDGSALVDAEPLKAYLREK